MSSTLTGTYLTTITLDNGTSTSPLTLTSTAVLNPAGHGATGVYAAPGLTSVTIANAGIVSGGYGGLGRYHPATGGGIGVDLAAGGRVINKGVIVGGNGGYDAIDHGGDGGTGVAGATNAAIVADSGVLTLAGGASFTNSAGAISEIAATGGIAVGAGAGAVVNAGLLEKIAGTGTSTVAAAAVNDGTVKADSGRLTFAGAFTNNASATVAGGALLEFAGFVHAGVGHSANRSIATGGTLRFDGAVGGRETVSFRNNSTVGGTLVLPSPGGFGAMIAGFEGNASRGDTLEIFGKTGLSESYSGNKTSGTLTLKQGATTIARLHFKGDYSSANFHLPASGRNTFITALPTPNAPAFAFATG